MVLLLFTRLADLFGSKASSKGLKIHEFQGDTDYSEGFKLWCRKLDDLKLEDFKRGMEGLEKRAEDEYRLGNEMWPPSYAEFRALAFPASTRDTIAHKPFEGKTLPEPKEYRSKRYEEGVKQTAALLSMFDDKPEPKKPSQEELADMARLEAIKNAK